MNDPIAALHARYRASFPDKQAELSAALAQWQRAPADAQELAALYLPVHKLAGSAGAYGFDTLAALARAADLLIHPHARAGVAPGAPQIAAIESAVQTVLEALASA